MKIQIKRLLFACLIAAIATSSFAQNAKKFYKDGKKELKEEKYTEAISLFSQAIDLDNNLTDAYIDRAFAYEKSEDIKKAAEDYKKASELDPKDFEHFYNAGRLYYTLKDYNQAINLLNSATELEKKHLESYQIKIQSLIALEKYSLAYSESVIAIDIKKTDLNYYHQGIINFNLKKYEDASTNFEKALRINDKYIKAYVGLANAKLQLGHLDDGLEYVNKAIALDNKLKDAFLIRSEIYHKKADYPKAINDLSTILSNISPDDVEIYYLRAEYYQEFNQHQNAINDFCKVLNIDEENAEAYFKRAVSYEEISKDENAVKDYEKFTKLFVANTSDERKQLQKAKERIYFLNKEANKPEIAINTPKPNKKGNLEVRKDAKTISITGKIIDESELEYLTINGEKYVFPKNVNDNSFDISIDATDVSELTIAASDIYHNLTENTYKIELTEVDKPKIHLLNPYASDNGEIYLETTDATLFIEGKITDESSIASIDIDGVSASYIADELNPSFTATISIANKSTITFKVKDKFGNINESKYSLNREGAELLADNPMGKTWVVFIENSNYQSFASLDGPTKDVSEMKSAFANYKIQNIIHKKDMSKSQMERFFSIELRDLVKKNRVNSLLVWYAGHGKFIHETGYWIPVNATRDDEFTYFNINNLKASMQSYSKYITHTLVITDACESGPSFYMAMRNDPKDRDCGNWQATKFKSSQVFTSAGNELAADKSQFTQTFSNTLKYNPDDCIAIENIVTKVTKAVSETGSQKPRFGKIAGLEDEDGTFFFIKK